MSAFSVSKRRLQDGCDVLEVSGEVDLAVAAELKSAIDEAGHGAEVVVIDLENCEFIDSSGIAAILTARRTLKESGRRLAVSSPHDQVERILSVSGLTQNGLVFASPAEALGG